MSIIFRILQFLGWKGGKQALDSSTLEIDEKYSFKHSTFSKSV